MLLSGYHAASHRYWCDSLQRNLSGYEWTCLSLPARHFNWRIRGAPLSWIYQHRALLSQPYDLLITTSMVDLATLKGLVPSLSTTPTLHYFHENQFEYPASCRQQAQVEAQMVNLYSALAADMVLFNSVFNRDSFIAGANRLLQRLPDHRPKRIEPLLEGKLGVLAVPIDMAEEVAEALAVDWRLPRETAEPMPLKLLWAARWEYDKGPDQLLAVLQALRVRGCAFRLCLLGEQFRQVPEAFKQIEQRFASELVKFGFAESRAEYLAWLGSADQVLSTSLHEFQGVAVLEAIAAGCVPVLPARLAYPELVAPTYCYTSSPDDPAAEAEAAAELIIKHQRTALEPPSVERFSWGILADAYRQCIEQLTG